MKHKLISLAERGEWQTALEDTLHTPVHTWEYCRAMTETSKLDSFLFVAETSGGKVVCPVNVRQKCCGYPELVSPYGFGGFGATSMATIGSKGFVDCWDFFCHENGFITAYIMQHPAIPLSESIWGPNLHNHHALYLLDLRRSEEMLLRCMAKTHRYEIRRLLKTKENALVVERSCLRAGLVHLYPETIDRVNASSTYSFCKDTLESLAEMPGTVMFGVEEGGEIVAVTVFICTSVFGDYFLNASTHSGRKYTRLLVWSTILELKRRGVTWLNLGGGVQQADSLENFKRRFGGRKVLGQVLKQVLDREKYAYLMGKYGAVGHSEREYFPPYWATGSAD